jgi:hypothetical protein
MVPAAAPAGAGLTSGSPPKTPQYPDIDTAVDFLLASFIWLDIIASASARSAPILKISHSQVLGTLGVSLESLIGCSNSVIGLILEVSLLDEWKKSAQSANTLSVVDLAKRGEQLHKRLRHELVTLEVGYVGASPLGRSAGYTTAPAISDLSRIYILSAVTYLHVVVSGPHPQVPEIEKSVSETIVAFKRLKDPRLIRHMVWPFCITGCMALERHYDLFRGLASRAGINKWDTGTCFEAIQVMEECWKARITSSKGCDWATAMKLRGAVVFLG